MPGYMKPKASPARPGVHPTAAAAMRVGGGTNTARASASSAKAAKNLSDQNAQRPQSVQALAARNAVKPVFQSRARARPAEPPPPAQNVSPLVQGTAPAPAAPAMVGGGSYQRPAGGQASPFDYRGQVGKFLTNDGRAWLIDRYGRVTAAQNPGGALISNPFLTSGWSWEKQSHNTNLLGAYGAAPTWTPPPAPGAAPPAPAAPPAGGGGGAAPNGNTITQLLEDPNFYQQISQAMLSTYGQLSPFMAEMRGLQAVNPATGMTPFQAALQASQQQLNRGNAGLASSLIDRGLTGVGGAYDQGWAGNASNFLNANTQASQQYGPDRIGVLGQQIQQGLMGLNLSSYDALVEALNRRYGSLPGVVG